MNIVGCSVRCRCSASGLKELSVVLKVIVSLHPYIYRLFSPPDRGNVIRKVSPSIPNCSRSINVKGVELPNVVPAGL